MRDELEPYLFLIVGLLFLWLLVKAEINTSQRIKDYFFTVYEAKGQEIASISKLNFREQMKYGISISVLLHGHMTLIPCFTPSLTYYRKIELSSQLDGEMIGYVELSVRGNTVLAHHEIDSYKF